MLVRLGQMPAAVLLEALNDEIVGFRRGDQAAFDLGPGRPDEGAVPRHRPDQCETVLDAGLEVVGAERRGHVHQPRPVLGGHEIAEHDDAAGAVLRERMLELNRQVNWHPPEVGEGRFGEWLEGNIDWAISRARYWGTPLPNLGLRPRIRPHVEMVGSYAELAERLGEPLPGGFDPHKP